MARLNIMYLAVVLTLIAGCAAAAPKAEVRSCLRQGSQLTKNFTCHLGIHERHSAIHI